MKNTSVLSAVPCNICYCLVYGTLLPRTSTHPFERIGTPLQVFSWTAPALNHAMDCVRAEDASSSQLGYEGHVPGQVRSVTVLTFFRSILSAFIQSQKVLVCLVIFQ